MGLSTSLSKAARELKKDLTVGTDIREALLVFADKVEKASDEAAKKLAKNASEDSSEK